MAVKRADVLAASRHKAFKLIMGGELSPSQIAKQAKISACEVVHIAAGRAPDGRMRHRVAWSSPVMTKFDFYYFADEGEALEFALGSRKTGRSVYLQAWSYDRSYYKTVPMWRDLRCLDAAQTVRFMEVYRARDQLPLRAARDQEVHADQRLDRQGGLVRRARGG